MIVRTVAIVLGMAVLYVIAFGAQLILGVGPAGASSKVPAGSEEWFAAGERWVRFDTFVMWPLLIIAGAALQRVWCGESPVALSAAIAIPAVAAHYEREPGQILLIAAAYAALALCAGALVDRLRTRSSTDREPTHL